MSLIELSVIVPLYNEVDNVEPLCAQITDSLAGVTTYEVVLVDDGSTDGTAQKFQSVADRYPEFRLIIHPRNAGQSAGLCSGVLAARGHLIATMDGDLQNDPVDLPMLLQTLETAGSGRWLIAGNRSQRHDHWLRRISSRIANRIRNAVLHDQCPDTGCSLKLFRRDDFLLLPQFNHMHRFLPALMTRQGVGIINVPVNHRPRIAGVSKYGVRNRLWVGIVDLFAVRWLNQRAFAISSAEFVEISTFKQRH